MEPCDSSTAFKSRANWLTQSGIVGKDADGRYLKDLFTRLPTAKNTRIKKVTPTAWAKAKAKEKVVAQAA